jgi:peptidoglycan/xylan/chitin deacetylase (PgdA/CDA1 family)
MAVVDRIVDELGAPPTRPAHLDWPALERLAAEGVRLAPHSRSHALLDRLPADALADEIGGSMADLETRVRDPAPVFAFPGGRHDTTVVAAVAAAGLEAALTTHRGINDLDRSDRYRLRRINVGQRTNRTILAAQLLSPVAWRQRDPRSVGRRPPIL